MDSRWRGNDIGGQASGPGLRRREELDQCLGRRLRRLFREIMPTVERKAAHVGGPFAPSRERIIRLRRNAAGAAPERQHRAADLLGRGAGVLVMDEIGGTAGAVVFTGRVDPDGVVEKRMVVRQRAWIER